MKLSERELMHAAREAVIAAVMRDVRTAVMSRNAREATEAAARVRQWADDMINLEKK